MRIAHVVNLGIKEMRGLARDPILMFLMAYSFTLSIYAAATAMPDTLNRAAIAIVDEDQSPVSSRIITSLYPPFFVTPKVITQSEMDARMDAGLETFALDIPPNFQRDLLAGRSPTIQLNVDATRASQAFTGGGYVQAIVSAEVDEFLNRYRGEATLPVELALRARFNPELNKKWFGSIAEIISSIAMLSIVLTGAALIREREHGTIEHLLVMPVTPLEIMVGKVWSMGLVVLIAASMSLLVIVKGVLGVPIAGSLMLFMAGTALMLFATTSLGIFLATVAGSMPQFGLLVILVLMPLEMLSGAMTPRESMPDVIQYLMLAAPTTHFVLLVQAVLFRGAGISVVWPQFFALALIGGALFTLALGQFTRFLR